MFYFEDPFSDLCFLHTLTLHAYGGSEIGEAYAAAATIAEGGDRESWHNAWARQSDKSGSDAIDAEQAGHKVTAKYAYLRAVTYRRNAMMACFPSDRRYRETIWKSRELFRNFARLCDPPIEVLAIPFEGSTLPGYFLRPDDGGGERPTIICADNASEELYYWIGPPALERGYNAVLVDLPGIGLNPFDGLEFRVDVETGMSAILDYLYTRDDVDTSKIALYGGGEPGGYIAARAAAHEPRLAACIADPLVSEMAPVGRLLVERIVRMQASGSGDTMSDAGAAILRLQSGITDPSLEANMTVDTSAIDCALLCMNDATDNPVILDQAKQAMASASNPANVHRVFTSADGTNYRQMDNFRLKHSTMFDWLETSGLAGSGGRWPLFF